MTRKAASRLAWGRDRMAAFGGTLTIESTPGAGTTVTGSVRAAALKVTG